MDWVVLFERHPGIQKQLERLQFSQEEKRLTHARNKSELRHFKQDEHGSSLSHLMDVVDGRF